MSVCRGCGADAVRTSATYNKFMDLITEVCPACEPERFQGVKVTDPSDRKLWSGYEVEPERYYDPDSENVVRARDELRQDIWDEFNRDPDEQAREEKRRTRRTEPMSADEIAQKKAWGENVLRPQLEEARNAVAS